MSPCLLLFSPYAAPERKTAFEIDTLHPLFSPFLLISASQFLGKKQTNKQTKQTNKNLKELLFIPSFIVIPWVITGKLVHYSYRPIKPVSNLSLSDKTCIGQ